MGAEGAEVGADLFTPVPRTQRIIMKMVYTANRPSFPWIVPGIKERYI